MIKAYRNHDFSQKTYKTHKILLKLSFLQSYKINKIMFNTSKVPE